MVSKLTNELSPWIRILLDKLSPLSQEIPCILWNSKLHYRVHGKFKSVTRKSKSTEA